MLNRQAAAYLVGPALAPWSCLPARAQPAKPIAIVAAENFYGDVAKQIGGATVSVTSILTNPDQDPHLFEASPSVARNLSAAALVIYNGIDYDPWGSDLDGRSPQSRSQGHQRGRTGRQEARGQPAYLVRSGHHADTGQNGRRHAQRVKPVASGGVRPQPRHVRTLDAADHREDRGVAGAHGRHPGHGDRAGVRAICSTRWA